jgi:hypothetical protein
MSKVFKVVDDLVVKEINGQSYAVPVGKLTNRFKGIVALNPTVLYLWPKLIVGTTKMDLVEALCSKFEVSIERASNDVESMILSLITHQLIVSYEL